MKVRRKETTESEAKRMRETPMIEDPNIVFLHLLQSILYQNGSLKHRDIVALLGAGFENYPVADFLRLHDRPQSIRRGSKQTYQLINSQDPRIRKLVDLMQQHENEVTWKLAVTKSQVPGHLLSDLVGEATFINKSNESDTPDYISIPAEFSYDTQRIKTTAIRCLPNLRTLSAVVPSETKSPASAPVRTDEAAGPALQTPQTPQTPQQPLQLVSQEVLIENKTRVIQILAENHGAVMTLGLLASEALKRSWFTNQLEAEKTFQEAIRRDLEFQGDVSLIKRVAEGKYKLCPGYDWIVGLVTNPPDVIDPSDVHGDVFRVLRLLVR